MIIDYNRDALLSPIAVQTLHDRYLAPGETSPQDRFAAVAKAFADDEDHAQRLYDYMSQHWFAPSTPIMANGGTGLGLPISCYLSWLYDSREGLVDVATETRWLAMLGGGVGLGVGLRSPDEKSTGIIPHLVTYNADTKAYRQSKVRRGSTCAYLDLDHPEIMEFIRLREMTKGDRDRKTPRLHLGVNVPDIFMKKVENLVRGSTNPEDDIWELRDPHTRQVTGVVSVKMLWQELVTIRGTSAGRGGPFIHFIDTSNRHLPLAQKKLGLRVRQSNLCTEITLATDEKRTAVCCLSSTNLDKWEEWKNHPHFIEDLVRFLDNVIEHFIQHAPPQLKRAIYSAMRERSIGIGTMGFHSLLQSKMIPFTSPMAVSLNRRIYKHIKEQAKAATTKLAQERGACPDSIEGGDEVPVRNMHLLAIAPNATSSIFFNVSPSIEPWNTNGFTQKTLSGSFLVKNPHLDKLLASRIQDEQELADIWSSIVLNEGSVYHLPESLLSDYEKSVFDTSREIEPEWLVQHVVDRQPEICQAQSMNLFWKHGTPVSKITGVMLKAWKGGAKSIYYSRNVPANRADKVGQKITRVKLAEQLGDSDDCLACHG